MEPRYGLAPPSRPLLRLQKAVIQDGYAAARSEPSRGLPAMASSATHHGRALLALKLPGATSGRRSVSRSWRLRIARCAKQVLESALGLTVARVEWLASTLTAQPESVRARPDPPEQIDA